MTKITPRLAAAIHASSLPDKEIARIINEAGKPKPAESPHEALADAHGIKLPETPPAPETPAADSAVGAMTHGSRRRYNRRDMKAK